MLEYSLAKELKDNGFPLIDVVGYCYDEDKNIKSFEIEWTGDFPNEWIYIPTLSELIEACGNSFERLIHHPIPEGVDRDEWKKEHGKNWEAGGWIVNPNYKPKGYPDGENFYCHETFWGWSPEEAVANLWLKLKGQKLK